MVLAENHAREMGGETVTLEVQANAPIDRHTIDDGSAGGRCSRRSFLSRSGCGSHLITWQRHREILFYPKPQAVGTPGRRRTFPA